MANQPITPTNTNSGFFDLKPSDLKDPTLLQLNRAFRNVYALVNRLFSPGSINLSSTPTFKTALASNQDSKNVAGNEFITKATADSLYTNSTSNKATGASSYNRYNPKVNPNGMTYAPAIDAFYAQDGNVIKVRVSFTGTSSGASTKHITVDLPVPPVADDQCLTCAINDSSDGFLPGCAVFLHGKIEVTRVDGGNFGHTALTVNIGGVYQSS